MAAPTAILAGCNGIVALITVYMLSRIIYYRHKLISFQVAFLALTMLWSLMRCLYLVILDLKAKEARTTATIAVFWSAQNIQFATFSLLILFDIRFLKKQVWQSGAKATYVFLYCFVNGFLLLLSLMYVVYVHEYAGTSRPTNSNVIVRATTSALIFVVMSLMMIYYGTSLIAEMRRGLRIPFQSVRSIAVMTYLPSTIFIIRSIYSTIAATGIFISQIGTRIEWHQLAYYLLVEVIPAIVLLYAFRRIPKTRRHNSHQAAFKRIRYQPLSVNTMGSSASRSSYSPVFDDPNRYDSDSEAGSPSRTHSMHLAARQPVVVNARPTHLSSSAYGAYNAAPLSPVGQSPSHPYMHTHAGGVRPHSVHPLLGTSPSARPMATGSLNGTDVTTTAQQPTQAGGADQDSLIL